MAADAPALDGARIAAAFEHAPALTGPLLRGGPYADPDAVLQEAERIVATLGEPEQAALLAAHPRIGADPATLSAASAREQGGETDPAALRELTRLNGEYERRFGFRFVVFVAGRPKAALLPVLRERLARERASELRTGLAELLAIARDRLTRPS